MVKRAKKKEADRSNETMMAENAAVLYKPGPQPDIGKLMREAFQLGYKQALIDYRVFDETP